MNGAAELSVLTDGTPCVGKSPQPKTWIIHMLIAPYNKRGTCCVKGPRDALRFRVKESQAHRHPRRNMTASSVQHNVRKHSSAKEERKLRKPLIERKRRERINNCLDQLKETVIEAFRLDPSKLEKADILELTVKHLQNIQTKKFNGLEAQQKYSTGYIQCMQEVHNMPLTCEWMDKMLGSRLLNHLLKSLPKSTDACHPHPSPRQDVQTTVSQGMVLPGTPLRGEPLASRQLRKEGPTCHVAGHQERPALHSSHLGMLEMWRPW